jgi:hypothetical protein
VRTEQTVQPYSPAAVLDRRVRGRKDEERGDVPHGWFNVLSQTLDITVNLGSQLLNRPLPPDQRYPDQYAWLYLQRELHRCRQPRCHGSQRAFESGRALARREAYHNEAPRRNTGSTSRVDTRLERTPSRSQRLSQSISTPVSWQQHCLMTNNAFAGYTKTS